ncbi:DgyrCDS6764 [Dimorphilus gyrociliatus]|uniref:DgyrCDS6764 n=1 Tax=Dimorphilus gyrociliatus TaxID=2664684 RepID=A0A7I8VRP3_9ANNE|nr:DgyrCDS6764 [Dimorphilus gyrociliatus]
MSRIFRLTSRNLSRIMTEENISHLPNYSYMQPNFFPYFNTPIFIQNNASSVSANMAHNDQMDRPLLDEISNLLKIYPESTVLPLRDAILYRLNLLEDQRRRTKRNLGVNDTWMLESIDSFFNVQKRQLVDKLLPVLVHLRENSGKIILPQISFDSLTKTLCFTGETKLSTPTTTVEHPNPVTAQSLDGYRKFQENTAQRRRSAIFKSWYDSHSDFPYPNRETVQELAKLASCTEEQVKKWFANHRSRNSNTMRMAEIIRERRKRDFGEEIAEEHCTKKSRFSDDSNSCSS